MYVVTKLPNTSRKKRKKKENHTGFVGIGGRREPFIKQKLRYLPYVRYLGGRIRLEREKRKEREGRKGEKRREKKGKGTLGRLIIIDTCN